MALTFEAKNFELARKKKYLFDVSRKDHSNGKKVGCRINPKSFHVHRDKATPDRASNSTTKTKHNTERKGCAIDFRKILDVFESFAKN